jgi:hypothetical protein
VPEACGCSHGDLLRLGDQCDGTQADLMAPDGHASPAAAIRYQHTSADRNAVVAYALAELDHPAPARKQRRQGR